MRLVFVFLSGHLAFLQTMIGGTKMLVVLFPPKSSLDSLSHSLAYLKDWQHVATDTFKQQILGSILQGVPKNAPLCYS